MSGGYNQSDFPVEREGRYEPTAVEAWGSFASRGHDDREILSINRIYLFALLNHSFIIRFDWLPTTGGTYP
jgi:hypothetical protein